MNHYERLQQARRELEAAQGQMRLHEMVWQSEWESAPNPFVAIKRYLTARERARRQKAYAPLAQARENLAKLEGKKK